MFSLLATFALGLALLPFLDYAWHAWLGHGPRGAPSRADHLEHHRTAHEYGDPWGEIRQNIAAVLLLGAALGAILAALFTWRVGAPLAAALVFGYVAITLSHARMHQRAPRTAWEHWFWRFHFHHHYGNPRVNFGLTSPLFDLLFGTLEVPAVVELPEAALPAWWCGEGQHPGFSVRKRRG